MRPVYISISSFRSLRIGEKCRSQCSIGSSEGLGPQIRTSGFRNDEESARINHHHFCGILSSSVLDVDAIMTPSGIARNSIRVYGHIQRYMHHDRNKDTITNIKRKESHVRPNTPMGGGQKVNSISVPAIFQITEAGKIKEEQRSVGALHLSSKIRSAAPIILYHYRANLAMLTNWSSPLIYLIILTQLFVPTKLNRGMSSLRSL